MLIARLARQFSAAPALVSREATLSYGELAIRCHQYARWGVAQGFQRGDTVCLMMANCAEYMAIWLGLSRIGAIAALINNNLAGEALVHSINIVAPRAMIVDAELAPRLTASAPGCRPADLPGPGGRSGSARPGARTRSLRGR